MTSETRGPFDSPPTAAERPTTPSEAYGVPARGGEQVPWDHVRERLSSASAYWLATVGPGSRPHVVPVWGALVDGDLFLETGDPSTAKARHLQVDAAIAVHLDDADDVVIVTGTAEPARPARAVATRLAEAMRAKYAGYEPTPTSWDEAGLHRVVPDTVLAWRDMPTATRWRFRG